MASRKTSGRDVGRIEERWMELYGPENLKPYSALLDLIPSVPRKTKAAVRKRGPGKPTIG